MTGKDILVGLGHIDEQFIHEAETKKPNQYIKITMPLAAGFAVVILSFMLYQNSISTSPQKSTQNISPPTISVDAAATNPSTNYKLHFNHTSILSASKIMIKGHFWNTLDQGQIRKILPILTQNYEVEGTVHYSSEYGKASLYEIAASVIVNENLTGKITIAPNEIVNDYIISGDAILSEIEGIPIEAGLFITDKNSRGERNYIYYADFKIDGIAYYIEFASINQEAEAAFTSLVADVILGGKADLSIFNNPTLPKIIEKDLTEKEAYSDSDFGKYLIKIPNAYLFNSANRLLNQNRNLLSASWSKGYDDVSIMVSKLDKEIQARIVAPEDISLYDMSRYPIPWVDSMPREQSHIIENPVFRIEDLTLDMIQMRGYIRGEVSDPSGDSLNMRFSVLYGDIVVEIKSEGLSAEYLLNELSALAAN